MKKKRKVWEKVLCTAAAVAVLAGGGFLGVEKFHPQKRSLQILEGDAQQTSAKADAEGSQRASVKDLSLIHICSNIADRRCCDPDL